MKSTLLALPLLAIVGCAAAPSGEESGGSASAITGGTTAANNPLAASIVQIDTSKDGHAGKRCTGILVERLDRILTGVSCDTDGTSPTVQGANGTVVPVDIAYARVVTRSDISMSPTDAEITDWAQHSVQLMYLKTPLAAGTPVQLAASLPATGDNVTVAGYGCTTAGGATSALGTRTVTWRDLTGYGPFGWFAKSYSCDGNDIGAAVLDGSGALAGIAASANAMVQIDDDLKAEIAKLIDRQM